MKACRPKLKKKSRMKTFLQKKKSLKRKSRMNAFLQKKR